MKPKVESRVWREIDHKVVKSNFEHIAAKVAPSKVLAVLKADELACKALLSVQSLVQAHLDGLTRGAHKIGRLFEGPVGAWRADLHIVVIDVIHQRQDAAVKPLQRVQIHAFGRVNIETQELARILLGQLDVDQLESKLAGQFGGDGLNVL